MLNLKDPEAHRLARAIADETGESMTRAVIEALRLRYASLKKRRRASVDDLLAIADMEVKKPYLDHGQLLYDDHGLPK
jgi:antitoxin VapB